MKFLVIGLNHRTAPLEIREKLAVTREQLPKALETLKNRLGQGVILSTCNRSEFYTVSNDSRTEARLKGFISGWSHIPLPKLAPHLYVYYQEECVRHLFRVASGLDSMILGESQILGQVRDAFGAAAQAKAVRGPLSRLFHQALRVGKRVRRETALGQNALSVSRACVELARRCLGDLGSFRVTVIGAGEAGRLAAKAFKDSGTSQILVTNRNFLRAMEVARELGGEALPMERLPWALAHSDIVISCTDAPEPILRRAEVEAAMQHRSGRPLFLIDNAVPRDIDPSVKELPNVYLYDVDDLEAVSQANRLEREKEAEKAELIVREEMERFMAWWRSLEVVPTIAQLRERAEAIRQRELSKTLRKLEGLPPEQAERLDALTKAIVKKLLHHPITFIKERRSAIHIQVARELFQLEEEARGR